MHKTYSIIILLIVCNFVIKAQQISNGGFETWSNPKNPDGWFTFSSISNIINIASKDTTDKVEGNASAKIQTVSVSGSTTYEILSLGTADYSISVNGPSYKYHPVFFPFRPDTFFFAYKYSSPGTDTASVYIKFSNGNDSLLEKVVPLFVTSQWSYSFILLTPIYLNANNPDSLLIQFKSSIANGDNFGTNGSTLNVDALRFGYKTNTAFIQELKTDSNVNIFPNPATQSIYADCPKGYKIFSSTGRLIKQSNLPASNIIINDLPQGIYILKTGDSAGRFIKTN